MPVPQEQLQGLSCTCKEPVIYFVASLQSVYLHVSLLCMSIKYFLIPYSWFPPSRNVGNVRNGRNLVNVGRWRNGHTLHTLRKNMETKLHQWFLLVNSYGFYMKNRNRFYSYRFHVYVTFLPYTWKRIRDNFHVHVYVVFYVSYVNYLRYVKVEITS